VPQLERRINEAARLGFRYCLLPRSGSKSLSKNPGIELLPCSTLKEAVFKGLLRRPRPAQNLSENPPAEAGGLFDESPETP
ncbi:MAG TPA: hypothetical protein VLH15_00475, partial [Dehalococcoidales bacterium]|nr:hypothetical protein [Dehalococcoidales bacterium]